MVDHVAALAHRIIIDLFNKGKEAKGAIVRLFTSSSPAKRKSAICQGGRRLRFLPEAFGKSRGLVVLNLSNKQLQVHTLLKGLEKIAASADIPMLMPTCNS
ncbi:hypothetical protein V2J09_020652 [Rumex salicifolius]